MAAFLPATQQLEILTQGVDTVLPEGGLLERLEEERPLRVKLGVDPTAPDVTLGWAVVFRLLRRFQELGHIAVLIVGDFTARVGDPSGREVTRRRLDSDEVERNVSGVLETIKTLLLPQRLEVRPNSEWLGALDMSDVLELTSHFTVARIMDRDDFRDRWDASEPISLTEFLYPLLQALDSVAVEADIEIGGSDQLFNLLVGRDLQERKGQRPQLVMTVPLLVGTDGARKMSQSFDNYISVRDEPSEMFGKTMRIPDGLIEQWFSLAAAHSDTEAADIAERVASGDLHPGETKRRLASEIVAMYWDKDAAEAAEAHFNRLFVERGAPDVVAEYPIGAAGRPSLAVLLHDAAVVVSRSEARRLIRQGAVRIEGVPVSDEHIAREDLIGLVVRVGKRRFVRFVEEDGRA